MPKTSLGFLLTAGKEWQQNGRQHSTSRTPHPAFLNAEVLPVAGTAPHHPTPLFPNSQLLFKNIPVVSGPGISISHQRERLGTPKKEEAWDGARRCQAEPEIEQAAASLNSLLMGAHADHPEQHPGLREHYI